MAGSEKIAEISFIDQKIQNSHYSQSPLRYPSNIRSDFFFEAIIRTYFEKR